MTPTAAPPDASYRIRRRGLWVALLTLAGVGIRLIAITQPFVDHWDWRQTDVAMIARNFYLHGFHLLHPQIDWIGSAPGYVGTEFPLVPFLAALAYKVFGIHEWIGRCVSVAFFAISVPFFFGLVARLWNDRAALLAAGVYVLTPLSVMTGRVFMPDMPSLSCSIAGLYLFLRWLESGSLAPVPRGEGGGGGPSEPTRDSRNPVGSALADAVSATSRTASAKADPTSENSKLEARSSNEVRTSNSELDSNFEIRDSSFLFIATCLAINLAIAIKLPAIIIGLPMAYMAVARYRIHLLRQTRLWLLVALSLVPSLAWYGYAKYLADHNPPHHFFGQGGIGIVTALRYRWILHSTFTENLGPPIFIGMLAGLCIPPRRRYGWLFHWWLLAGVGFVIFAGVGNRHPWYRLPLVPPAAALCGVLLDRLVHLLESTPRPAASASPRRALPAGFCALLFAALAWVCYHYASIPYGSWSTGAMHAGQAVAAIAPPGALVITADSGDPQCLYYTGHKGFHFDGIIGGDPSDSAQVIHDLESLRAQGAGYLVLPQCSTMWWLDFYDGFRDHLDTHYTRARQTPEYVIFDLRVDRQPAGDLATDGHR